jgi:acid phosphatase type 7
MRLSLLLVAALLLPPAAAAVPEQVHASLDANGVAITWARLGNLTSTTDVVEWSNQSGLLNQRQTAAILATTPPATTLISASLGKLEGNITYRVGSNESGWSPFYNLSIPRTDEVWRIAAYGDHGTGETSDYSTALVSRVAEFKPHLILHAGDLAYADGDAALWDSWFRLIEPIAAQALYMAAPGNHEHEGYYPASGPNPEYAPAQGAVLDPYQQFRTRFRFPGSELSYSFNAGPIHVLVLNSEDLCLAQPATYYFPWRVTPPCDPGTSDMPLAQGPPNQALIDFARNDLAANQDAPWTFVLLHRPTYTSGAYRSDRILQQYYAPLFEQYGVDLVFAGHDHNYQRTYPMLKGTPANNESIAYAKNAAPIYIVTGGAGEGLYRMTAEVPAWAAYRAMEYHYVALDVTLEGIRGRAISTITGEAFDNFTIGTWREPAPSEGSAESKQSPGPGLALAALALGALVLRRRRNQQ